MFQTFGMVVMANRVRRDMSQSELGRKSGVDQRAISGYERGISMPNLKTAIKLADFFGISLDELAGRS